MKNFIRGGAIVVALILSGCGGSSSNANNVTPHVVAPGYKNIKPSTQVVPPFKKKYSKVPIKGNL